MRLDEHGVPENPYLFKGGIQDRATGWVHFGARWYNPTTGQWTQQDTLDTPLNPSNANRYAYAADDPINGIDATGNNPTACSSAIFAGVLSTVGLATSVVGLVAGAPTLVLGATAAVGFAVSAAGEVDAVGTAINEC
jgi:RHS repeat-associated protein